MPKPKVCHKCKHGFKDARTLRAHRAMASCTEGKSACPNCERYYSRSDMVFHKQRCRPRPPPAPKPEAEPAEKAEPAAPEPEADARAEAADPIEQRREKIRAMLEEQKTAAPADWWE